MVLLLDRGCDMKIYMVDISKQIRFWLDAAEEDFEVAAENF